MVNMIQFNDEYECMYNNKQYRQREVAYGNKIVAACPFDEGLVAESMATVDWLPYVQALQHA